MLLHPDLCRRQKTVGDGEKPGFAIAMPAPIDWNDFEPGAGSRRKTAGRARGVLEHCSFEKGILEKNWHAGPGMTQLNCPLHLMCGGKNIAATAIGPLAPVQSHLQDLANYILRFNTHALR